MHLREVLKIPFLIISKSQKLEIFKGLWSLAPPERRRITASPDPEGVKNFLPLAKRINTLSSFAHAIDIFGN